MHNKRDNKNCEGLISNITEGGYKTLKVSNGTDESSTTNSDFTWHFLDSFNAMDTESIQLEQLLQQI